MNRSYPQITLVRFALLLALLLCLFVSVSAQSATATLSGTIEDEHGGVIPGVTVTLTNKDTQLAREATTSEQGYFVIPLLPPGNYTLRAQAQGFAPVQFPNIVLNVGDSKALQIQLKAGDVNAQVTIDSDRETVRTDGGVGTVVERQFVANMPLNGRSLQALIQLAPGVVLAPATGNSATGSAQFSVSGQRTTSNYWMVDGVSANTGIEATSSGFPGASGSGQAPGTTALGGTSSLVSLDALQEFRIETSTFAAEFGRTPGGQISLVTRSGTNSFHGSASEYFRNEAMDANDWFGNANRQPKPKERQNLFGGVFGGPIKKDRFFFFASYEGLRLQQPRAQLVTVPTTALRSQAVSSLQPYLNALPLPNGPDLGNGSARLTASFSNPARFNVFSIRLDGRVSDTVTAFFQLSHAPSEEKARVGSLSQVQELSAVNDTYTGGLTWIAKPQLTADLRVNWTRNAPRVDFDLDDFGGAVVPQVESVFAPGRNPSFALSGLGSNVGGFLWGAGTHDVQRQFNSVGTVSWSLGSHQLKFGADYRRLLLLLGGGGFFTELLQTSAPRIQ